MTNAGTIEAGQAGVGLVSGGLVSNAGSALISGFIGVAITNASTLTIASTVSNAGTIEGYASGVRLAGGLVSNAAYALISGNIGVEGYGASTLTNASTVINAGTIEGGRAGVELASGGLVSNAASALISGLIGVDGFGSGTVTAINQGAITAAVGIEVSYGTVTNQGSIAAAEYVNYGFGVYAGGGVVTNLGDITAGRAGVVVREGAVVNEGGITQTATAFGPPPAPSPPSAPAAPTGRISYDYYRLYGGVYVGSGTVTNQGSIAGVSDGVVIGYGLISNAATAAITGYDGVVIRFGGTITNQGSVTGTYADGVYLFDGGLVTNTGSASIVGPEDGILARHDAGTVSNAGTIAGTGGLGVGIDLHAGGTLTNAGTIIGHSGIAAYLGGTSSNLLALDPGATFSGVVVGGTSASNTMELASASSTGTLSGLGTSFTNFGSVTVDTGASWVLTGNNTLGPTTTLSTAGTLALTNATLADAGTLVNNGAVVLDPSSLTVASLIGVGAATIDAASTLDVQQTIAVGETIAFAGTAGVLQLGAANSMAGQIDGFTLTDTIDLTGLPNANVTAVSIVPGNTLVVSQTGGPTVNLLLDPTQSFAGFVAQHAADGSGGTSITLSNACFRAGTRIRTERGDVPVEKLRQGDRVPTALGGKPQPVTWIGHRTIDCARHPRPDAVWPVRIVADAFGPGRPRRDLWLSPDHAVFVNDVLIPVKCLINHRSVVQIPTDRVRYYHVELPQHAVLFAEGLAAESYLDIGDRTNFANANGPMRLFPDFCTLRPDYAALWEANGCAPIAIAGPKVETARRMLLATETATAATRPAPRRRKPLSTCRA